jgi:hypothetical protein
MFSFTEQNNFVLLVKSFKIRKELIKKDIRGEKQGINLKTFLRFLVRRALIIRSLNFEYFIVFLINCNNIVLFWSFKIIAEKISIYVFNHFLLGFEVQFQSESAISTLKNDKLFYFNTDK